MLVYVGLYATHHQYQMRQLVHLSSGNLPFSHSLFTNWVCGVPEMYGLQYFDGERFLKDKYNLALMVRIFFSRTTILLEPSIVWLWISPLQARKCYPVMHEPAKHINTYLQPFINTLGWCQSVKFKHKVRCALLCVACDMPGGRKKCGFLAHSAILGCSKCFKNFPGLVGENWTKRTMQDYRQSSIKMQDKIRAE